VQVLVTRTAEHAHWLVHFVWSLHFVTTEKGKAIETSYSYARSFVPFSWGFILWHQENVFLFLTMIQKRKSIKTLGNQIYTRGLRPLVQIRYPRISMLFILHIFLLYIKIIVKMYFYLLEFIERCLFILQRASCTYMNCYYNRCYKPFGRPGMYDRYWSKNKVNNNKKKYIKIPEFLVCVLYYFSDFWLLHIYILNIYKKKRNCNRF
jgi:hypothetical protein